MVMNGDVYDELGPKELLPNGNYVRYNSRTKRWYLYNPRGRLIKSNHNKSTLMNWKSADQI